MHAAYIETLQHTNITHTKDTTECRLPNTTYIISNIIDLFFCFCPCFYCSFCDILCCRIQLVSSILLIYRLRICQLKTVQSCRSGVITPNAGGSPAYPSVADSINCPQN